MKETWPGIRTGSSRVSVYNEALLVFLWDEAHLNAIEAAEADFEGGYGDEPDKALKRLAKDGVLIAYELAQDDAVEVEVVVGPALTKRELAVARWHKPQSARLSLPSGVLRIDTGDTFPVDSEPHETPGRVNLPPGGYFITLFRLDWDKLALDGLLVEGEEWTGPHELIVLTPDDKPIKANKPLLKLPEADTSAWKNKYKFEGQVFRGKAFARSPQDLCFVNIDRAAAEKLGLSPGAVFKLQVGELTLEAVFVGEGNPGEVRTTWVKGTCGTRAEFAAAYRPTHDADSMNTLVLNREVTSTDFPVLKKWVPATVTVLSERMEVPTSPPPEEEEYDFSGLE